MKWKEISIEDVIFFKISRGQARISSLFNQKAGMYRAPATQCFCSVLIKKEVRA
jgi:hypothetical protein